MSAPRQLLEVFVLRSDFGTLEGLGGRIREPAHSSVQFACDLSRCADIATAIAFHISTPATSPCITNAPILSATNTGARSPCCRSTSSAHARMCCSGVNCARPQHELPAPVMRIGHCPSVIARRIAPTNTNPLVIRLDFPKAAFVAANVGALHCTHFP